MDLDGAVVLVTGASSGIGAATARAASQAGARVALMARREDRVRRLADELGDALAVPGDVTAADDVAEAVRRTMEAFGRVDVLVNNAGQGLQATVEETSPEDFRALLELNLVAPLRMIQAVLPVMRRQGSGSIVNVSSGTTLGAEPGTGAYVASKIGLEKLSAITRAELAGDGIAVSTVIPFLTRTEFIDAIRAGRDAAEQTTAHVEPHAPEQVAETILQVVRSGDARADLVPAAYGGSYDG
jgi:NADP-dependent 3-hydroxy acid dehydrogenase YdfG